MPGRNATRDAMVAIRTALQGREPRVCARVKGKKYKKHAQYASKEQAQKVQSVKRREELQKARRRRTQCVVAEMYANSNSTVIRMASRRGHKCFRVALHKLKNKDYTLGRSRKVNRVTTVFTDLNKLAERKRVLQLFRNLRRECRRCDFRRRPRLLLLTSPDCAAFSQLASSNKTRMCPKKIQLKQWRARRHLGYCRRIHAMFRNEPLTLRIHEQPQGARVPSLKPGGRVWPWAIAAPGDTTSSSTYARTRVHGCATGLRTPAGDPLKKPWIFETTGSAALPKVLRTMTCPGNHKHALVQGRWSTMSASYTPPIASTFIAALEAM